MKTISIDIETYSGADLRKTGVYRYAEAPDFALLLFGCSVDGGPVQVIDLACGERIPAAVLAALEDPAVTKWAFHAAFERICLSRYLGYPAGTYLSPAGWRCSMVWAATLGLPLSLADAGAVLGLEKQKLAEGRDLVRFFCRPQTDRSGGKTRSLPADDPEKWAAFRRYNARDVETEMALQEKFGKYPVPEALW